MTDVRHAPYDQLRWCLLIEFDYWEPTHDLRTLLVSRFFHIFKLISRSTPLMPQRPLHVLLICALLPSMDQW